MDSSPKFRCTHHSLLTIPSTHAQDVGYQLRNSQQLFTASTGSRKRVDSTYAEYLALHPAPLVLPGDDLSHDPDYPPQSFASWKNEKARNAMGEAREVVYVAEYPKPDDVVDGTMVDWDIPVINGGDGTDVSSSSASTPPPFEDVLAYLQAFFHGLPVKRLDDALAFTTWDDRTSKTTKRGTKSKSKPKAKSPAGTTPPPKPPPFVGLSSASMTITTRIRVRHLSASSRSPYVHQLNLNDILDHAIAILPSDAYALLLLVSQDLYEDDNDDFCIGRAYGGSRIAVVSGARYQPSLDVSAGVDASGNHSWPASHCRAFVDDICKGVMTQKRNKKHKGAAESHPSNPSINIQEDAQPLYPLNSAILAHNHSLGHSNSSSDQTRKSFYTRRLSLTTSHELLHCFGLDHCVYLACAMQGTASVAEDTRQPPYLCPICESKLAATIVLKLKHGCKMEEAWWANANVCRWRSERRQALIRFCERKGEGFAGLEGWYRALEDVGDGSTK